MWGDVWFWEGDFMPPCAKGTVSAVRREVRIHQLSSLSDVLGSGPFYRQVNTPLVATTWSDEDGFFQAAVPAGIYSVFVVEDSLLYANSFDGHMNIFPVKVDSDLVTPVLFNISYRATY